MAKAGADSGNLVGGDGRANAAAADQYAALGRASADRLADRFGKVRIINRGVAVGSDIDYVMREMTQIAGDHLFHFEAGMVRTDDNAHRYFRSSAVARSTT